MSSREYPGILPINYHTRKVRTKRDIMAIPFLNEFVQSVWPGTPTELWAGFMSNGGPNEDTVEAPNSTIRFHELGYFGTEGGPRRLPAPNSDTSESNNWFRFHNHPKTIELLGRPACMEPDCWRGRNNGLRDQIAVGLVAMRYGQYEGVQRLLRPEIRASGPSSFWAVVMTFMAWSAGYPTAARIANRYAADLARVPESQRWDTLLMLYSQDLLSNTLRPGPARHGNPFYSIIRTQQKIAVGSNTYEANTVDDVIAKGATNASPPAIQPNELRASPTSFTQPVAPTQVQRTTPPPVAATQDTPAFTDEEYVEESQKEQNDDLEVMGENLGSELIAYTDTIIYPLIILGIAAVGFAGYKYIKARKAKALEMKAVPNPRRKRKKIKIS